MRAKLISIVLIGILVCWNTLMLYAQGPDSVITKERYSYNIYGELKESSLQVNNGAVDKTRITRSSTLGGNMYPMLDSLLKYRFLNLPIFKENLRNDTVVSAEFYEYEPNGKGYLKKLYKTHFAVEDLGKFIFANEVRGANPTVQPVGASYELEATVELFNKKGQPLQLKEKNGLQKAIVYDEEGRIIANVNNAKQGDVAYYYNASDIAYFQERNVGQFGNWVINNGTKRSFVKSGLDPTKTYILSFFGTDLAYTIQGGTIVKAYENNLVVNRLNTVFIKGASTVTFTLTAGTIEHLRLHPRESLMENTNYGVNNTIIGKISPNLDRIKFDYDNWGRITGQSKNTLLDYQTISYQYLNSTSSILKSNWDGTKSIVYSDAFGRAIQQIDNFKTDTYKVSVWKYDAIGRLVKSFDPFITTDVSQAGSGGPLYLRDTTEQVLFFKDSLKNPNTDYNLYPYVQHRLDKFTNEIIEQEDTGPYFKIANVAIPNSGHTTKFEEKRYSRLGKNHLVKYWSYDATGLKFRTAHRENVLLVTTVKGPNWKTGKANTTMQYTNEKGNLIIKKEFLSDVDSAVTYYLYDKLDRLAFIVPPGAPNIDIPFIHANFFNYIYSYKYDRYGQVVEKKLPAQGKIFYVYNKDGSLAGSQDSVQRLNKIWVINKYDAHGREVKKIQYGYTASRITLQGLISAQTTPWEEKQTIGAYGYTSRAFPTTGGVEFALNYYDEYETLVPTDCPWRIPKTNDTNVLNRESFAPLGMPVASKVKIFGQNKYIWSLSFYDMFANKKRSISGNVLDGYDEMVYNYESSFGRNLISGVRYVHRNQSDSIVSLTTYEYSDKAKLIGVSNKINNQAVQYLLKDFLDRTGKIAYSTIGGNSAANFVYKISPKYDYKFRVRYAKGTLKSGTNLFESTYTFDNIGKNDFRGNITAVAHKLNNNLVYQHRSNYTYDSFNRLKVAANSFGNILDNGFREYFSYDISGNIVTSGRYAKVSGTVQQVDSIKYYYDGFKHSRIDDISTSTAAVKALGFSELGQVAAEYVYDGNGRAIKDLNRGITYIHYNLLNLPDTIKFSNNNLLTYVYDAAGVKLSKHFTVGNSTNNTYYAGGAEYSSIGTGTKSLKLFQFGEGEVRPNGAVFDYLYHIKNQVGSPLMTLAVNAATNAHTILQVNNYYAYGNMAPYVEGNLVSGTKYNYLYGGKEIQDETGWYDHHARMYDPAIGRWNVADPLSESFADVSPYNHSNNNPINFSDPSGLAPVFQYGGWDEYEGVPDWVKGALKQYDYDIQNGLLQNAYDNRRFGWESYNSKIDGYNAALKSIGFNHVFLPIIEVKGFSTFNSFLNNVESIATRAYLAYESGAKFDTYINPAKAHLYGKNPYGAYMGPQNADEWEIVGDVIGSTEIPIAAQVGDLISLGANVYKGSGSGVLMSAAAFIPFGSQTKLGAKLTTTFQKHHIIPNQVYKAFKSDLKAIGWKQNDMWNLKRLPVPFHGNHPAYNGYIMDQMKLLKQSGNLNLNSMKKLQKDMRLIIGDAYRSGGKLNEYF